MNQFNSNKNDVWDSYLGKNQDFIKKIIFSLQVRTELMKLNIMLKKSKKELRNYSQLLIVTLFAMLQPL